MKQKIIYLCFCCRKKKEKPIPSIDLDKQSLNFEKSILKINKSTKQNDSLSLEIETEADSDTSKTLDVIESKEEKIIEPTKEKNINSIFPQKYYNESETSSSFHFEFTKENIKNIIDTEINDKESFKPLVNKNGFDIYIRQSGSVFSQDFPIIKTYYTIPKSIFKTKEPINLKTFIDYATNPEKRIKWDKSIRKYEKSQKISDKVYLQHYICKSPIFFIPERDIVGKRVEFFVGNSYYEFLTSVNDDVIPLEENVIRACAHFLASRMVEEKDSINITSITQIDTKVKIPSSVYSFQLPQQYKEWYNNLIAKINEENEEEEDDDDEDDEEEKEEDKDEEEQKAEEINDESENQSKINKEEKNKNG